MNVSQSIRKRDWIDLARNSDPLRVRPVLGAQRTIGDESLSGMESMEWGETEKIRYERIYFCYQSRFRWRWYQPVLGANRQARGRMERGAPSALGQASAEFTLDGEIHANSIESHTKSAQGVAPVTGLLLHFPKYSCGICVSGVSACHMMVMIHQRVPSFTN